MRNPINKLFLTLCLVLLSLGASAQEKITVSGQVTDEAGEGIIGASVLEAGTTNGTITDFDGNFKLQVKPNATLRFSYIGFTSQSVRVNGQKTVNVTLLEDRQVVEEVVVVGYGHQKKESVIGAISQVNTKELLKSPSGNVSQALAGKVAGLVTSQTSGAPGADDMQLFIRGRASFAGDNQPLVMVMASSDPSRR